MSMKEFIGDTLEYLREARQRGEIVAGSLAEKYLDMLETCAVKGLLEGVS